MHKETVFIFGFAKGARLPETMRAATFAHEFHKGQRRDDGADYVEHPIQVCLRLISHGIRDDEMLAAALLHDVLEDTETSQDRLTAAFSRDVVDLVVALSKRKDVKPEVYYAGLAGNARAAVIKAADRACNVCDMIHAYTPERLARYLEETRRYILPMMKAVRRTHLEFGDILVSLRDQIEGVLQVVEKFLELKRMKVIPNHSGTRRRKSSARPARRRA